MAKSHRNIIRTNNKEMKVLFLKNKISDSFKTKLQRVSEWFGDLYLEFTEERISKTILNSEYTYVDGLGQIKSYEAVDESWYDENISKPAKERGFDIVTLLLMEQDWVSNIVEGFGTVIPDYGVEEIALKRVKNGRYSFTDGVRSITLPGDRMTWIIIHELLHRIYHIKGLPDNTHKYFLDGTPEKCLEDFKTMNWKYFKLTEKTGSLGHTVADLNKSLVDKLDILRGICGFPFNITSGYRTEEENKDVGGVEGSAHTKRLAVDIACSDAYKRMKIVGEAYKMGFMGIGIDKNFVHLDIDSEHDRRIWLY